MRQVAAAQASPTAAPTLPTPPTQPTQPADAAEAEVDAPTDADADADTDTDTEAEADVDPATNGLQHDLERLLDDAVAQQRKIRDVLERRSDPAASAAQPVEPDQPNPRRHLRLPLLFGAAALVVILIVSNVLGLKHVTHRTHRPAKQVADASTRPPEINAAASWARRMLSPTFQIIADPDVSGALKAAGFRNVKVADATLTQGSRGSFDYLVSSESLRAQARSGGALEQAMNSSVPIAAFGSGARRLVIQQATDVSAAAVMARRRADRRARIIAERQLLTNPAVHASIAAQIALRNGELDLRAATVLALLANSSHVDVVAVNVDAPEQAAGLPARSIDVRTDAPASFSAVLGNLPPAYTPSENTQLANGTNRMSWPIAANPPVGLN